jgi:hypothetical protein
VGEEERARELTTGEAPDLDAAAAADRVARLAQAAVEDAKAQVAAAQGDAERLLGQEARR